MYRFRQRRISLGFLPSAVRRATYAWVVGQLRIRVVAMVCSARFRARSPPRLSRCRTVRPLLAGSGLAPPRAANAASLRQRPGWENDTMAWAALTGPMPRRSINPGTRSLTMVCSWGAVGLELAGGLAQGERGAAELGVPDGVLAAGRARWPAAGQGRQAGLGERAAG